MSDPVVRLVTGVLSRDNSDIDLTEEKDDLSGKSNHFIFPGEV